MKKRLTIIILSTLIVSALTNPSKKDFDTYMDKQLSKNSDSILDDVVKSGLKVQSNLTTKHSDYVFFSTVKTKVGTEKKFYVGVFGLWL